ncbi:hypothetical protein C5167_001279 [Papaver somniferum]|uniref:UDP-glycosyltransferase n=1 Tax=Papaver somniferum TaxID=3469 RepID=A0A4Y7KUB9_PAPSO|nr:UDP-glycosyltransferase 76B1 [Papaver somniferum]RZC76002.1 hypothetical protein C5167_001279 [Papaver somniferum]
MECSDEHTSTTTSSTITRKRPRLVLFPCPYLQGHINPMLQLATLLHSKGFSITIIHTRFNSPNPSDYPHFHFAPISSSPDSDIDQFHLQHSTSDIIAFISALNVKFLNPFRDCLTRLLSDGDTTIACVITDALMHFTQDVANNLHIPRIVLRTSSPTSFVVFAAYPLLLQKGYLPVQDSELEKPVPELSPLKVKDLPTIKTKDPELLYELVIQMIEKTKSSSGLIFNSFESLEHLALDTIRRDFTGVSIFPIGPFHKWSPASSSSILGEDRSCIFWLDEQAPKSVIYVSFGSLADMEETELVETAWGLVNSGRPFLWVVRPGLVRSGSTVEHLLPDEFQEMMRSTGNRGCLVKWAPQEQVLAHPAVGGFWTHNGWNSTLEGVSEGVPMLCRPCFTDQLVNARYASDVWKVGFQFDERRRPLERGDVEKAVKRLMKDADDDHEAMMARVRDLKHKAANCLKKGGSSYESIEKLIDLIMSFQIDHSS